MRDSEGTEVEAQRIETEAVLQSETRRTSPPDELPENQDIVSLLDFTASLVRAHFIHEIILTHIDQGCGSFERAHNFKSCFLFLSHNS
jgi:hypothetical protein